MAPAPSTFHDRADIAALEMCGARVEVLRTMFRATTFPRHAHDTYTIGVGLRGVGSIWCHGSSHVRRPGDIVVIEPGQVHTGGVGPQSELLSYAAAYVPPSVIQACALAEGQPRTDDPGFRVPVFRDDPIASALRAVARLPVGGVDAPAARDALAVAIALLVRHHGQRSSPHGVVETSLVHNVRAILLECFADQAQTSLESLAAQVGVTSFHVIRAFTRATGLSPHQYLTQVRVRRAQQLLARGGRPAIVAAMTGFADQSHLTRQFRRYTGITPGHYQRCLGLGAVWPQPDESLCR